MRHTRKTSAGDLGKIRQTIADLQAEREKIDRATINGKEAKARIRAGVHAIRARTIEQLPTGGLFLNPENNPQTIRDTFEDVPAFELICLLDEQKAVQAIEEALQPQLEALGGMTVSDRLEALARVDVALNEIEAEEERFIMEAEVDGVVFDRRPDVRPAIILAGCTEG